MTLTYHDCETQSEADIKRVGGWLYASHPSTRVLCWVFFDGSDYVRLEDNNHMSRCEHLGKLVRDPTVTFVAHNAPFEQAIWYHQMHKKFGYPEIPITRWKCTMAKCHAHGLPGGLGEAAELLGLTQQKDDDGHKLMLDLSRPRRKNRFGEKWWTAQNAPEAFERLYEYCEQDVRTTVELDNTLRDLPPRELRAWKIDQENNQAGIRVDIPCVERAIILRDEYETRTLDVFRKITGLDSPRQVAATLEWINERIDRELTDLRADTVRRLLDDPKLSQPVRLVLRCRQELSKSSLGKLDMFLDRVDSENIMRENYIYHSAHTGRWTSVGVQIANLRRSGELSVDLICEALLA